MPAAVVAVHLVRRTRQMRAIRLIGRARHRLPIDAIVVAEFEVEIHAAHAIRACNARDLLGGSYGIVVADSFIRRHRGKFTITVKHADVRLLP